MTERWVPCRRNEAYEVSSAGRVRRQATGRVLMPNQQSRGYLKVSLGRRMQVYVHQLVCEAFHGPRPGPNYNVDHLDFDRTNNAEANLRWLVRYENAVRWADRQNGRNVWATPDDVPEDHVPMTEEERDALLAEQEAAGW